MTVQELIDELSKHNPNQCVMVEVGEYYHDGDTLFGNLHCVAENQVRELRSKGVYFESSTGHVERVVTLMSDDFGYK